MKKILVLFVIITLLLQSSVSAGYVSNTDSAKYYNYMLVDMPAEASPGVKISKIFFSKCQLARSVTFTKSGQSISFKIDFEQEGSYFMYLIAKSFSEFAVYIDDVQVGSDLLANKKEWNRYMVGSYYCDEIGEKTLRIVNLSDTTTMFYYMGAMFMYDDMWYYTAPEIADSLMLSEPGTSAYTINNGNFYKYIQLTPDAKNSTPVENVAQKSSFSFEIDVRVAGTYKLTGRFLNSSAARGKYNLYVNDKLMLENYVMGQNTTTKHDQLNVITIGATELQQGKNMITLQCAGPESEKNKTVFNVGLFALMIEKK